MNRRGFTMVELLASVAILGILSGIAITAVSAILNKAHEEYYNSQEKNLVLAAQAYYNANKTKLPKIIGKKEEVTAAILKEQNYLKEELSNYDGKPCGTNPDSFVTVFKYGQSNYSYTAYLNCGKRSAKETKKEKSPGFNVEFPGGKKKNGKIVYEDVATSTIVIKINGDQSDTPSTRLISYSYAISYYDKTAKKYVEVFNTGNKETREVSLTKTVDLSKYTISGSARIRVKVTATNILGNTNSKVFINNYDDKTAPYCKYKNNENNPNSPMRRTTWRNTDDKVTADCLDDAGSGCEKDSYTKLFTKDGATDVIKMKDNAGNSYECPIITFIDKTPPTVEVVAYKCGDSTKTSVKTISVTGGVETMKSGDLTDNYDEWLNKKNYPEGVCFDFKVTDAAAIKRITWSWNRANHKKNASGYTTLDGSNSPDRTSYEYKDFKNLTNTVKVTHHFENDGHRYGVFVAEDGIGNQTKIKLDMLLDRVAPTMTVTAGRCVDRNAITCNANTRPTDTKTVTVNNSDSSETINMKTWEIKGIRIAQTVSDNLSSTSWKWQWDTNSAMQTPGNASLEDHGGGTKTPGSSIVVTLTGTGQRQGIMRGYDEAGNSVKVTINGWVSNQCIVTYDSNSGSFNSNSGNIREILNFQDYINNNKNLMKTVRGKNSYFYGTRNDYVIAYEAEWKLGDDYYDQSKVYYAHKICNGMTDGTDKTPTLKVKWLKNNKKIRIYEWKYKEKKCSYKKDSKKKTDRPYREYSFYAYQCLCEYDKSSSALSSKAYYARHSISTICTPFLLYKDANNTQKDTCFEETAHIYYRKSKKGKKACSGSDTDDYPINTYVYQICNNGEPFKFRGAGEYDFFHGVRFFYGSKSHAGSSYLGSRIGNYWLTNSKKIREDHSSSMLTYDNYSHINSLNTAINLSYDNDKSNRLQSVCNRYCKVLWGEHRNVKQDSTVDDTDETISTNTTGEDIYQDEEEEEDE